MVVCGRGSTSASGFFGGGYYSNPGVAQSTITGFSVDGGYETQLVEETIAGTEEYCVDKIVGEFSTRPVQALRIDDRNTPHPASCSMAAWGRATSRTCQASFTNRTVAASHDGRHIIRGSGG